MQMVEAHARQQCGPQAHQQAGPHDSPTRQTAGRESHPDRDEHRVALGQKGRNRSFGVGQTVHLEDEPQRAEDPDAQSLFPFQGIGADGESGPGTVWIESLPLATDPIANQEQRRCARETAGHQQGGQEQAGVPRRVALPQLLNGFEQREAESPEGTGADQDQRGDDPGVHEKETPPCGGVSWNIVEDDSAYWVETVVLSAIQPTSSSDFGSLAGITPPSEM